MKKFFGLKMALAVLAAGAFVSCSDSEAGDIYIPTPGGGGSTTVEVKYPAAQYVVSGVVTDAENGTAINEVAVSGAITATTDANGYFTTGMKAAPMSGVVTFTKEGYISVNRTLVMAEASTGVVSESMNVVMTSGVPVPAGEIIYDGDPAINMAEGVVVPAAKLANLVNESNEEKVVFIEADGLDLPYGAVFAPTKADATDAYNYILYYYGNDATAGYGIYKGVLAIVIPANSKVVKLIIYPLVQDGWFKLDDFEAFLNIITQYNTGLGAEFAPIDAHNPHDVHNGSNVGGGAGEGA
jgi:hypothetical protein